MFKQLSKFMCDYPWLKTIEPVVLVHGGAGNISDNIIQCKHNGVKLAARIGYESLQSTGCVLDAVQNAVRSMELDEYFNAGYGSALTWEGKVEMDAAIMNGADLAAGSVSLVHDIAHPVELARRVMQKTRHTYLAGDGAMALAKEEKFEILREGALITKKSSQSLQKYKDSLQATNVGSTETFEYCPTKGTVGAVAIDGYGNLAAATSTGGITGKMPGRIGDSPLLGCGTYADNAIAAVSATGNGETIMRYTVAARILAFIQNSGMNAQQASEKVLIDMTRRLGDTAGVIAIDRFGNLGIFFTSNRMSWAYQRGDELHYGIERCEDNVEVINEPRLCSCDLERLKDNDML